MTDTEPHFSAVQALGYLGLRSKALDEWPAFAGGVLGMQVLHDGPDRIRLRMDDKAHRYILTRDGTAGVAFIGLQLADAEALESLSAALHGKSVAVQAGTAEERALRQVQDFAWITDPDGNRVELFHGLADAQDAFAPAKPIGGFRTGELGLGHLVLYTPNHAAMSEFYRTLLDFRLSDFHQEPYPLDFLRVNARHHSLGLISDREGPARIHHTMVEYQSWDDVGRAYDHAQAHPDSIAVTLGRHLNDHMTSFYIYTPDRFFTEVGWAGRLIDEHTWEPYEIAAPSLWGHDRRWQTPERRAVTREMIQDIARQGIRAPIALWDGGPFSPAPTKPAKPGA